MFCFTVFCGHQGCSLTLTEISTPALALTYYSLPATREGNQDADGISPQNFDDYLKQLHHGTHA